MPPSPRRRRRIGWLRPLLAAPVILFVGSAIGGLLINAGAPETLSLVPTYLGAAGAIAALIVAFVGLVNALSPGTGALTPEEAAAWAEYVRQNGGEVEPRRTSGVLLAVAAFLTIISAVVVVFGILNLPALLGLDPQPAGQSASGGSFAWLLAAVVATPIAWERFAKARAKEKAYRSRRAEREAQGLVAPAQPWTPGVAAVGTRRHRMWVLPLLCIPAVILTAVLIIVLLRAMDAPGGAIRAVSFTMLAGIAAAMVLLIVGIVRFFRARPAPRAPRPPRRPGFYAELSSEDAKQRGLTPEEYGVYKGNVGSMVDPVNSVGGLLVIAILLTVINVFLFVLIGVMIAQANGLIPRNPDDEGLSPVQWGFLVFQMAFVPVAWRYYLVERRAQKLRTARGLPKTLR
jgi:hypothetical protein